MYSLLNSIANVKFQLFSPIHIMILLITGLMIGLLIVYRKEIQKKKVRQYLGSIFTAILLTARILEQIVYISRGIWNIAYSLPLHLCGISSIACIVMLMSKNYNLFEIMYFWCLIGSPLALLFPNLNGSNLDLLFWIFMVSHSMNIISVIFMMHAYGYRPTIQSVKKTILCTNGYMIFIAGFNYVMGANYYYINLAEDPSPNLAIPLRFISSWPIIILLLELFILLAPLLLYLPYYRMDRHEKKATAIQQMRQAVPQRNGALSVYPYGAKRDTDPKHCGKSEDSQPYDQHDRPAIPQQRRQSRSRSL